MPGHGNGADGDASIRSVLPGIRAGLALELAPCPGDGSAGHRQLAVHDGRQALGAVPPSGACTRPGTDPSGTWVPRVGSAGRVKGVGEPPQLRDTVLVPQESR